MIIKSKHSPLTLFLLVFLTGTFLSAFISWKIVKNNEQHIRDFLTKDSHHAKEEILGLLNQYQYGLRAARGAVLTAGEFGLSRAIFRRYSLSRDIDKEFPGAHGFGFIRKVSEDQEREFLVDARLDGKPDFKIQQLAPHSGDRYVIQYIEPEERNTVAIGLDTASETNRREAADAAVLSGNATITNPITLVQATGHPDQAFLIFLPVYHSAVTPATEQDRGKQVFGWTYTPLLMKDLFANLPSDIDIGALRITLSDVTKGATHEVFYTSHDLSIESLSTVTLDFDVLGRRWQMDVSALPIYKTKLNISDPTFAMMVGLTLSALFALLAGALGLSLQKKNAIATEQARLAAIVESAIDGIIGKNLDGIVISWNHGAENIFGYTAQEAIGRSLADLIVPDEIKFEEERILARIRNGETVSHFTTVRQRRDGSRLPVSAAVAPIRDAKGIVIGASKTVRDITAQKAAEDRILELNLNLEAQVVQRTDQLEQARRSLQTILDAVPSMIGYWDKHLINRAANKAYHDYFNLDEHKIPGMHAIDLLGPELFERVREKMEAALLGEPQTFNQTTLTPDGNKHSLAHYLPDIKNGEVQGFHVIVHDVTEVTESNTRLKNAIRENHALLSTINQQLLFSVTDTSGNFIDVNDNFLQVSGYSRQEIIGQNHRLLTSDLHSRDFWNDVFKQLDTKKPWHGEICHRAKNGELFWFDAVIAPFSGADENIERFISLYINITERKKNEEERTRLNLLITNVLSAASEIAIVATDREGTITIFNRGAELMLHYTADELIGKFSPALFHLNDEIIAQGQKLTEEYGIPIEGFRAFVHKSEIEGAETRIWTYIRKDGSHLQVSLSVTALRDADGKITGYLGVATDVTEELQNKRALKSTIDQFTIATDVAELGVWSWIFADNSFIWNDRMFDIFSLPRELRETGLSAKHWQSRMHPDDIETTTSSFQTVIEHGGIHDITFRIIKPDNSIRYIQSRAQIERDNAGKAIKATGVNRDVTSQKELESWLRQAKENADSASASKSAFLANMSHEIRTPMNAVLGMLQLVQHTELTPRQQDYISKSQTAAKSLLGLLNDILDFSKIDSGKLQLDNYMFELEPLMRDLAIILSGNQGTKDVEIMFDVDPLIPKALMGDRLRLQQILINLAGNALKFTSSGEVIVKLVLIEKSASSIRLQVAISDTGIGISPEQINRIFDGFVQAEASTTRRFGGTGLGLVISKHLVNLMGGELHVESELGSGSRFWFDIALGCAEEKETLVESTSNPLTNYRILVVDDNTTSRTMLASSLLKLGAQVDEVDCDENIVSRVKLQNKRYDVILLNYRFEKLEEPTKTKSIYATISAVQTPVLVTTTAYGMEVIKNQENELMQIRENLLIKPITPQQLTDSIISAVRGYSSTYTYEKNSRNEKKSLLDIRILVIEDNALNRQVASELLTDEGAHVDLAEGGLEGVTKVFDNPLSFDIVIMDMQMPDIDGMEATRRIRANPLFKDLPILAMTANVSSSDIEACISSGMNDHVGKPIDMEEVIPAILALVKKMTKPVIKSTAVEDLSHSSLVEDVDVVLKRFSGKIDLYKKLLNDFPPQMLKLLSNLTSQHETGNIDGIILALHSMKGLAGTVGAKALALKASNLEKMFKSNESPHLTLLSKKTFDEFESLLEKSCAHLMLSLTERSSSSYLPKHTTLVLSEKEWKGALLDVLALLKEDNLNAINMLEKLSENSQPSQRDLLVQPLTHANALQFDTAIQIIDQLLSAG